MLDKTPIRRAQRRKLIREGRWSGEPHTAVRFQITVKLGDGKIGRSGAYSETSAARSDCTSCRPSALPKTPPNESGSTSTPTSRAITTAKPPRPQHERCLFLNKYDGSKTRKPALRPRRVALAA